MVLKSQYLGILKKSRFFTYIYIKISKIEILSKKYFFHFFPNKCYFWVWDWILRILGVLRKKLKKKFWLEILDILTQHNHLTLNITLKWRYIHMDEIYLPRVKNSWKIDLGYINHLKLISNEVMAILSFSHFLI